MLSLNINVSLSVRITHAKSSHASAALVNIFLIMSDVFRHYITAGIGSSVTHFQLLHSTYSVHRVHYMHLPINTESPHSLFCHLVIIP